MGTAYKTLRGSNIATVRRAIRRGSYASHTAGLGKGLLQGNLVIMPDKFALDFMRYCQRNPKPCPLIGVSDTGNPHLGTLGEDLDVRTDLPVYNIYRYGELYDSVVDIGDFWSGNLVAFVLGCSFTFEHALMEAGVELDHIRDNKTVPMFRTDIETVPAGPFKGAMVASMRMIPDDKIDVVRSICGRFPLAHGAPIHWGDPAALGIRDPLKPDWGDPVAMEAGKTPVFWACGVTPQVALQNARLPLCITHKPGHMLITDIPDTAQFPVLARLQSGRENFNWEN